MFLHRGEEGVSLLGKRFGADVKSGECLEGKESIDTGRSNVGSRIGESEQFC